MGDTSFWQAIIYMLVAALVSVAVEYLRRKMPPPQPAVDPDADKYTPKEMPGSAGKYKLPLPPPS